MGSEPIRPYCIGCGTLTGMSGRDGPEKPMLTLQGQFCTSPLHGWRPSRPLSHGENSQRLPSSIEHL